MEGGGEGLEPTLSKWSVKNEGLEPTLSNDLLKNEGLEMTLLNDWLKMGGWNWHCRMIGLQNDGLEPMLRAGTDIVDSSSHFPMIGAQLSPLV